MAHVRIFLSAVGVEFRSYCDALRRDMARTNVAVAMQEDFNVTGTESIELLDDRIRQCDAVIHLVGDMTGTPASAGSLAVIRGRYPDLLKRLPLLAPFLEPGAAALSCTQWEAWLALYHGKPLLIAVPEDRAPRDPHFESSPEQRAAQQAHLQRLAHVNHFPSIRFGSVGQLAVDVLRSKLFDHFVAADAAKRIIHLPYASLKDLFMGRAQPLAALHASLGRAPAAGAANTFGAAVYGPCGIGKTRLAIEYAWHHAQYYAALLFVTADGPEALRRNLAALHSPAVLDLPDEQKSAEEAVQFAGVLGWLQHNQGWLLILDNVDSEAAAQAVEGLLPQVPGGHVLITSSLRSWSGGVHAFPLEVLDTPASIDFLLARTEAERHKQADDAEQAGKLAEELGGLALDVELAGTCIAQRHLSLAAYLAEWRRQSDKLLTWYDAQQMQFPKSVAVTWQTVFDRLGEPARHLLQRLAWLAPDSIPESLLDVAVPGVAQDDAHAALAELASYSLVARVQDAPAFSIHRLVQAVTRCNADAARLSEALGWIDDAFVGDAQDVRNWPLLDPLLPHVLAVAGHADEVGIAEPTARLMNHAGMLLHAKALHAEAQPLYARALAIWEKTLGPAHPDVATRLKDLAQLLKTTNRNEAELLLRRALAIDEHGLGPDHPSVASDLNDLALLLQDAHRFAEAEPLMRRALAIDEQCLRSDHPTIAIRLNNLAQLLQGSNRLVEAEPLMRRALAIDEQSFGPEHPNVARALNNLAQLLQGSNRLAEAEPLMRRALAIDEQILGSDHPKVAIRLNNLAALLKITNRLAEAEPLMRRALAIDEQCFGLDHPKVALRLNNLAALLRITHRLPEAEPLMRRAVAVFFANLGADHPNSQAAKCNYAALLGAMGYGEDEILEKFKSLQREVGGRQSS